MINTVARNRSTDHIGDVLESSVTLELTRMLRREPAGLAAAGIDPAALVVALLGGEPIDVRELFAGDPATLTPDGAKRKVVEDEDEDDDDEEEDDDVADDEEEDEDEEDADEDEDDLDEDEEDEDDEDDEDEDEEDDEFDDPDDDDDYDDDDDEDDFDDE